jgi:hypothetical protein
VNEPQTQSVQQLSGRSVLYVTKDDDDSASLSDSSRGSYSDRLSDGCEAAVEDEHRNETVPKSKSSRIPLDVSTNDNIDYLTLNFKSTGRCNGI